MIHLTLKLIGVMCGKEPGANDKLLPVMEDWKLETSDLCPECKAEYMALLRRMLEDLKRD